MGPIEINSGKTPYFLKVSKIREVIYVAEWVCTLNAYRRCRNSLPQAGYTDAIARKGEQLLLTLAGLEQVGQFLWGIAFSESSKREIAIDKAMCIVQLNYRITMALPPNLLLPRGAPLKREAPGDKEKSGNKIKRVKRR